MSNGAYYDDFDDQSGGNELIYRASIQPHF